MSTTQTTETAIPSNLTVETSTYGLSLRDPDGGRWWPTESTEDEQELARAYAAGEGRWHD